MSDKTHRQPIDAGRKRDMSARADQGKEALRQPAQPGKSGPSGRAANAQRQQAPDDKGQAQGEGGRDRAAGQEGDRAEAALSNVREDYGIRKKRRAPFEGAREVAKKQGEYDR